MLLPMRYLIFMLKVYKYNNYVKCIIQYNKILY